MLWESEYDIESNNICDWITQAFHFSSGIIRWIIWLLFFSYYLQPLHLFVNTLFMKQHTNIICFQLPVRYAWPEPSCKSRSYFLSDLYHNRAIQMNADLSNPIRMEDSTSWNDHNHNHPNYVHTIARIQICTDHFVHFRKHLLELICTAKICGRGKKMGNGAIKYYEYPIDILKTCVLCVRLAAARNSSINLSRNALDALVLCIPYP